MRAVVNPKCPLCKDEYIDYDKRLPDREAPYTVTIKCRRCNHRYYVSMQKRYVGRDNH